MVITVDGLRLHQADVRCWMLVWAHALLLLVGTLWRMVRICMEKLAGIMGRDFEQLIDDQPRPKKTPRPSLPFPIVVWKVDRRGLYELYKQRTETAKHPSRLRQAASL